MRQVILIVTVVGLVGGLVGTLVGGIAMLIWRRKLVVLLKQRHPTPLNSSPDVAPLGIPMASASRLLKVVRNSPVHDVDVARVAGTLGRLYVFTLTCALVMISIMVLSKFHLWPV
jgi:hypothetical protein